MDILKAEFWLKLSLISSLIAVTTLAPSTIAHSNGVYRTSTFKTYVISTYGGSELLPSIRQVLVQYGGSVSMYQNKLVLRTTSAGYQAVQNLLKQVDNIPQTLTVSVKVGANLQQTQNLRQGQIVISRQGIGGYGHVGNASLQTQNHNLYQLQTLSGSTAQISTGTLLSLAQPTAVISYYGSAQNNARDFRQVVIMGHILANAMQGITVTPRLLSEHQVQISFTQVQDTFTNNSNYPINTQGLNTTIVANRGAWITIGNVTQNTTTQGTNYDGYHQTGETNTLPIQIKID